MVDTASSKKNGILRSLEKLVNTDQSVLVLGDFMLDRYILGASRRISPEGPVPVVKVNSELNRLGGAGNVVANLAGLTVIVHPVGILGTDVAGAQVRQRLTDIGCSTDYLVELANRPTVEKIRIIAQNQQVVRVDREDDRQLDEETINQLWRLVEKVLPQVDVCLISDYGKGVCQPFLLRRVIDAAKQQSIPVLVDPKGNDFTRYAGASCITPNILETATVVPLPNTSDAAVTAAASQLQDTYQFNHVLITRGADGMTLLTAGSSLHISTKAHEVYDVSGAGDTVIATLAAALASGTSYEEAAKLANAAAGVVVSKLGTVPILLTELRKALLTDSVWSMQNKVMSLDDVLHHLILWREQNKKIVFTNGCFDILHIGHLALLEQSAKKGDVLIVGLNSDTSVRRLKGESRPINAEQSRALMLAGLTAVDAVVIFEEDTPLNLLQKIRPDVLIKGNDYKKEEVVGGTLVESYGGTVALVPLIDGYSTTEIVNQVQVNLPADKTREESA